MCEKQTYLQSKPIIVRLCNQFEAAGSVVTVKRSPVSTRVKARDTARGTDENISTGRSKRPLERDSV